MSGKAYSARPFPWQLALHWMGVYAPAWFLLAAVIFIVQSVLAAVLHEREDVVRFIGLLDSVPKFFKALIGGDELMPSNILGIVAIGYQHPLILTMKLINAVMVPTGLLTAQAERGTLELLLARPITRSRVYWLAASLTGASQIALTGVVFLGTAVWTRVFDYGSTIPLKGFFFVSVNLAALSLASGSISMLAAAVSSERNKAIMLIVAYFVASYLLDFAAVYLPSLKKVHPWTLYHYCRPNAVLREGAIPWSNVGVLLAIAMASLAAGWYVWRRRDLFAA